MLADYALTATIAVSDLGRAREFYANTLGLGAGEERADGVTYKTGDTSVLVYPSKHAGTNKATTAGFDLPLEAFDAEVSALREKGVEFQTFEYEGVTWEDGVATLGDAKAVWFTDPDGNILAVTAR